MNKSTKAKSSGLKRGEIAKMVINKREASKAKDLSEMSFFMGECNLARALALQAKTLDPKLAGIGDLISALDVFVSTDNKTGCKVDRYKVLGVSPMAEEAIINMKFKKLALSVHPDRNKSLAANGAFRIVSEAWSMLKCRETRAIYDKSRKLFCRPLFAVKDTFWTACPGCKIQFEYRRNFVNKNLTCPNCRRPFLAIEMTMPSRPTNVKAFPASYRPPAPQPRPSLAPNVGLGQALIPSGVGLSSGLVLGQALPSVPRFDAGPSGPSTREKAELQSRKRKAIVLMLETRGKADHYLTKNLSELEKREIFMSKAKKAIFSKVGDPRGPPPGFPDKRK